MLQSFRKSGACTAAGRLNWPAAPGGRLPKRKRGKSSYYVNQPLFGLLARLG